MKKENKIDKLIDLMYENKWLLVRYFAAAIVCSLLRYAFAAVFLTAFIDDQAGCELVAWCFWAAVFYPACKFFVFRSKSEHIYALLRQIIIYILMCAVLWFTRQIFTGILYVLTSQTQIAMSIGGFINELLCLLLMVRFVFRHLKD